MNKKGMLGDTGLWPRAVVSRHLTIGILLVVVSQGTGSNGVTAGEGGGAANMPTLHASTLSMQDHSVTYSKTPKES